MYVLDTNATWNEENKSEIAYVSYISKKCILTLGYQGNNLLCSNWDIKHLEDLDYNGMYEYLYAIRYQKKFPFEEYPNGIPKYEFEGVIMEYLPVISEQIQKHAVFDEETQTYAWTRWGCFNYSPTFILFYTRSHWHKRE